MVMEILLFELVFGCCCIFIVHRARLSRCQEKRVLQSWLDNVMRDALTHRERVGKHYLKLIVGSKRGAID